jgi:DNA repair protein RecO (recombination protein O)
MNPRRSAGRAARQPTALPTQLDSFVLHSWDWSETSLIVELLTRERGRLTVVARGAKRPSSQLRSVLLPFQRIHVQLARASATEAAEIHLLRTAEWQGGGPVLPPGALFQGFYVNELMMKLLPRHDAPSVLFEAYRLTLPALSHGDEWLAQAGLRAFELVLLREMGLLPDFTRSTLTQSAVQPAERYALRAEAGLARATGDEASLPGQHWLDLHQALAGDSLRQLQEACVPVLQPLKPQLRSLLQHQLGSQPLRTREVMQSVQRLMDTSAPAARAAAAAVLPLPDLQAHPT